MLSQAIFMMSTRLHAILSATVTNGAGTIGGKSISFKGGAGGTIDSGTDFSGTGAGWAKAN